MMDKQKAIVTNICFIALPRISHYYRLQGSRVQLLVFWIHIAPESTGHYYATLNTAAIATLVFSVCAAIAVVIRRRKLYRHVLVYLIPFCLISVQWMLYDAWYERSGLGY